MKDGSTYSAVQNLQETYSVLCWKKREAEVASFGLIWANIICANTYKFIILRGLKAFFLLKCSIWLC